MSEHGEVYFLRDGLVVHKLEYSHFYASYGKSLLWIRGIRRARHKEKPPINGSDDRVEAVAAVVDAPKLCAHQRVILVFHDRHCFGRRRGRKPNAENYRNS